MVNGWVNGWFMMVNGWLMMAIERIAMADV